MAYTRAPRQKSPRIGPFRAGRPLPRLASTFIEVCPPRAHFPPLADAPPLGVPVPARGGYSRARPIPDPIAGRGPWRSIQFPKSPRSGSKMRLRPWPAPRLGGSARRSPRARRASRPGGRRGRSRRDMAARAASAAAVAGTVSLPSRKSAARRASVLLRTLAVVAGGGGGTGIVGRSVVWRLAID